MTVKWNCCGKDKWVEVSGFVAGAKDEMGKDISEKTATKPTTHKYGSGTFPEKEK